MYEKIGLAALLLVQIVFSSGCTTNDVKIRKSRIQDETLLRKIPNPQLKEIVALNAKSDAKNVFQSADVVDLGRYKIIYNNDSDEIFVTRDGSVLTGVRGDSRYIYDGDVSAPAFGSEVVYFSTNYIKYRGEDHIYEDYGLDGVDFESLLTEGRYVAYMKGTQSYRVIGHGLACFVSKEGNGKLFKFTEIGGWEEVDTARGKELCKNN